MAIYRFQEDDVFVNTVTTYPQIEFAIYNGSAYYNNEASTAKVQDYHGYANLYEYIWIYWHQGQLIFYLDVPFCVPTRSYSYYQNA